MYLRWCSGAPGGGGFPFHDHRILGVKRCSHQALFSQQLVQALDSCLPISVSDPSSSLYSPGTASAGGSLLSPSCSQARGPVPSLCCLLAQGGALWAGLSSNWQRLCPITSRHLHVSSPLLPQEDTSYWQFAPGGALLTINSFLSRGI